jgi:hypothetical protein
MKISFRGLGKLAILAVVLSLGVLVTAARAYHTWGGYHWARTANPFTLKLGNNVSSQWTTYLAAASLDWTSSNVLNTTVFPGLSNPKNCKPVSGRVEVCNSKYGSNGWLGIASVWVNGNHITQGTVKLNDTYFSTAKYNTQAWRQFVVCQEIGHTFGLAHQDEGFNNLNMGTCMDYTNDPDGTLFGQLGNLHPNAHDYEELETIYGHLDPFDTLLNISLGNSRSNGGQNVDDDLDTSNPGEWGKVVRESHDKRSSLHEKDLGNGKKLFTFIIWAE